MSFTNQVRVAQSNCYCGHGSAVHYQTPDTYIGTLSTPPTAAGNIILQVTGSGTGLLQFPVAVTIGMTAAQFAAAAVATLNSLTGGNSSIVLTQQGNNFVFTPYGTGPYGQTYTFNYNAGATGGVITNVSAGGLNFVVAGCALCPDHHAIGPEKLPTPTSGTLQNQP